jgi:hypothetical protein
MKLPKTIENALAEAYGRIPIPVSATENRRFVYVNPAFCRFYSHPREFFMGKTADCLVEKPDVLTLQKPVIEEFNQELEDDGASLRGFTNIVNGLKTRVFVVAFCRSMGGRNFRVGIAMPDRFTEMTNLIADQLAGGSIDLDGFIREVSEYSKYRQLIRDLGKGLSVKESTAYSSGRNNEKAVDRIKDRAKKYINGGKGPRPSTSTIKGLSILIGDKLSPL